MKYQMYSGLIFFFREEDLYLVEFGEYLCIAITEKHTMFDEATCTCMTSVSWPALPPGRSCSNCLSGSKSCLRPAGGVS